LVCLISLKYRDFSQDSPHLPATGGFFICFGFRCLWTRCVHNWGYELNLGVQPLHLDRSSVRRHSCYAGAWPLPRPDFHRLEDAWLGWTQAQEGYKQNNSHPKGQVFKQFEHDRHPLGLRREAPPAAART
jgi:hypothetical protein